MTKVGDSYEVNFTVTFNPAAGNMAGQRFFSRGLVLLYTMLRASVSA